MNYIPLDQCQSRNIYTLQSRNLTLGVFDADTQGFIGIREKFGSRYLFTEYHYDIGPPHGTALPLDCEGELDSHDDRIRLWERYPGTICFYCGVSVDWQWADNYSEVRFWQHQEPTDCDDAFPISMGNYTPLFDALMEIHEIRRDV